MKTILTLVCILSSTGICTAQHWRYTGSLHGSRRLETLSPLGSGKILAAGGSNSNEQAIADCEVYDAANGQWSVVQSMTSPRERHTATALSDGRIVVIGGDYTAGYSPSQTSSIEIFDPVTGQWSYAGHLLMARQNHTATLLQNNTILIAGGYGGTTLGGNDSLIGSQADILSECEIYDPATMSSRAVASLHQNRHDHQAILLADGKVMVMGGRVGGAGGPYLDGTEVYDPANDTWTVTASMSQARIIGSLVQFSDGTVLASGGRNSPNSSAPGSEVWNESSNQWTSTDPMKQPVHWQGNSLLPNNRFLITGGFIDADWQSSTDVQAVSTCEWYDRQNAAWFYAPTMNQARAEHGAIFIHQETNDTLPQDLVLVTGGITGNNTYTESSEVLNVTEEALNSYKSSLAAVSTNSSPQLAATYSIQDQDLTLNVTSANPTTLSLSISDEYGRVTPLVQSMNASAGLTTWTIPLTNFASGVYFLIMHTDHGTSTMKFTNLR